MSWFHLSLLSSRSNLGALSFEARGGIFELNSYQPTLEHAVTAPELKPLVESWPTQSSIAPALQVWESEGGRVGEQR
jgi:hypothetical protein